VKVCVIQIVVEKKLSHENLIPIENIFFFILTISNSTQLN